MAKTLAEQITALENTRAAKAARMEEVQSKATDEGRTKDEGEREEFDTLRSEIKGIDLELVDLRDVEKMQASKAKPVEVTNVGAGPGARHLLAFLRSLFVIRRIARRVSALLRLLRLLRQAEAIYCSRRNLLATSLAMTPMLRWRLKGSLVLALAMTSI
jgi:hypothetical protein